MDLLARIHAELETIKTDRETVVIGIAGAGCVGKTTLAKRLTSILQPYETQVINLDGYMLERAEAYKIEPGMTGYDVRRNDLDKAASDIGNLALNGTPFMQRDYDRSTHQRTVPIEVTRKPFIIIDGVHALHDKLLPFIDYGIFIEAPEVVQYKLRLAREQREFGYDVAKVDERWAKYWPDYLKYIGCQKEHASVVLGVDLNYNLEWR